MNSEIFIIIFLCKLCWFQYGRSFTFLIRYAPNGCKFQGETGVTWFSFVNPVIGVAKGPAWEGAELVAAPGGFATPSFSWTSDLERLAFRDLDGSQLQLAEHFPAPVVTTLTSEAVSSFAFRP